MQICGELHDGVPLLEVLHPSASATAATTSNPANPRIVTSVDRLTTMDGRAARIRDGEEAARVVSAVTTCWSEAAARESRRGEIA